MGPVESLDAEFDLFRSELRAEISSFNAMFDRRLRWQARMMVGTAIASVVVSVTMRHLLA